MDVEEYNKELDRQRVLNRNYTKNTIVLFKLIDLKQNIFFATHKRKHEILLNRIKPNLIKYERNFIKFEKNNNIY